MTKTRHCLSATDPVDSARILCLLEQGEVLACPSESVWGLSCDPFNRSAVEKLSRLKHREADKGYILTTGRSEHIAPLLNSLPRELQTRAYQYWQSNTTLLIPDQHSLIPPWLYSKTTAEGTNFVAIRLTRHQPLVTLASLWDNLIVSTSANPSGREPAKSVKALDRYFHQQLPTLCGSTGGEDRVSKIINLQTGEAIR